MHVQAAGLDQLVAALSKPKLAQCLPPAAPQSLPGPTESSQTAEAAESIHSTNPSLMLYWLCQEEVATWWKTSVPRADANVSHHDTACVNMSASGGYSA